MWIVAGDKGTNLDFTIYRLGAVFPLTGLANVTVVVTTPAGVTQAPFAMSIADSPNGIVRYVLTGTDFLEEGVWQAQIILRDVASPSHTVQLKTKKFTITVEDAI
jgi:hypothetical protein